MIWRHISEYACWKYYKLFYTDADKSNQKAVSGIMINLDGSRLVMLTPKGMIDISHHYVERLEPREFPKDDSQLPEEFKKICKEVMEENMKND